MTTIFVGSRRSPLAQAQVQEILTEIRHFHPEINFECLFVNTHGDIDLSTSLRTLDKTDFFTKEVDDLLLNQKCQIAIHSAKDLPAPIHPQFAIVALTKGLDPADVLVMKEGVTLEDLSPGARIATSSQRREEVVATLRSDLQFIDLRGTIAQRLNQLITGEADGVVVAEAALIRLGLTHLNRLRLPGKTTDGQGQLAVLARIEDHEMRDLFACLDTRVAI